MISTKIQISKNYRRILKHQSMNTLMTFQWTSIYKNVEFTFYPSFQYSDVAITLKFVSMFSFPLESEVLVLLSDIFFLRVRKKPASLLSHIRFILEHNEIIFGWVVLSFTAHSKKFKFFWVSKLHPFLKDRHDKWILLDFYWYEWGM